MEKEIGLRINEENNTLHFDNITEKQLVAVAYSTLVNLAIKDHNFAIELMSRALDQAAVTIYKQKLNTFYGREKSAI